METFSYETQKQKLAAELMIGFVIIIVTLCCLYMNVRSKTKSNMMNMPIESDDDDDDDEEEEEGDETNKVDPIAMKKLVNDSLILDKARRRPQERRIREKPESTLLNHHLNDIANVLSKHATIMERLEKRIDALERRVSKNDTRNEGVRKRRPHS